MKQTKTTAKATKPTSVPFCKKCPYDNNVVSYYCRTCNLFICTTCRTNTFHSYHKILQIDKNDLCESVKLYALSLQNEINSKSSLTSNLPKTDYSSKIAVLIENHEKVKGSLKDLIDKYREMNGELTNIKNEYKQSLEQLVKEYSEKVLKYNDELFGYSNLIEKQVKKGEVISFEECRTYFVDINKIDKQIDRLSRIMIAYKVSNDLNRKMMAIFDRIDKVLDRALDNNTPLHLSVNSKLDYEYIKNNYANENSISNNQSSASGKKTETVFNTTTKSKKTEEIKSVNEINSEEPQQEMQNTIKQSTQQNQEEQEELEEPGQQEDNEEQQSQEYHDEEEKITENFIQD